MPYRRLPNTDTARIRAMRMALEKGKEVPPPRLAFSQKNIVRLERILPKFELNIHLYRQTLALQNKKNHGYNEILKKARIYLTHFIRVMNMAVFRGDLPPETRTFYALSRDDSTVPSLNTENELISWGKRVIDGEEFRIRKGGNPVTNPSVALVKVRYENFLEAYSVHDSLGKKILEYMDKNTELRKEADELILNIWNEVENHHRLLAENDRMLANELYGVKYFFRKKKLS